MGRKIAQKPVENTTRLHENNGCRVIVRASSDGQLAAIKSIASNTITICSGVAGTGKTHIAVATGLKHVLDHTHGKLVVTRPIVDAGESIGYLPGDIYCKTDPYMLPIYDIIGQFIPNKTDIESLRQSRIIEIAPLAYMRGRTLSNCFAVLDEAQNATLPQIKMFLTRLGHNAKMVLCGDTQQCDIGDSGFQKCIKLLDNMSDVGIIKLTNSDIIRHKLVGEILARFDNKSSSNGFCHNT